MKEFIPWPVKFAAKVLFGIARVDYRLLKRVHLVEHGRMEEARFAAAVFDRHVAAVCDPSSAPPRGALLELGPGDSIATGVLARAYGFVSAILVDVGPFADLSVEALRRLIASAGGTSPVLHIEEGRDITEQLQAQGIRYLTQGVQSLRSLAAGEVGHSFSNSVLQHVHRDQLRELIELLARAHAPGTRSSHSIKFTDHFSGGFLNHSLPGWFMESALIKRANLYTNRVSAPEFCDLFAAAGFDLRHVRIDFFGEDAPPSATFESAAALRAGLGRQPPLRAGFLLQKR